MRLEIILLIGLVFSVLLLHLFGGCCRVGFQEAFATVTTAAAAAAKRNLKETFTSSTGPRFAGAYSADYLMDPSQWSMPTLTYSPGANPDSGAQSILDRPKQTFPLPKGEMDVFANTPFKPECCPNAYSTSTGCACMDMNTYSYLRTRGSNNVPYSEY